MGVEVGGRASKLGDTYERMWAVRQALYVIEGRLRSLLWEPVGDDENGIDVWVTKTDGARAGHQLKRQNRDKEYWTVADLREEGVLQSAFEQLNRDRTVEYAFISSCGARHLRDLTEQSRRANNDPTLFYRDLVGANQKRKKEFHELMNTWNLNSNIPDDVERAFCTLQRMNFLVQERAKATRDDVEFAAGLLIDGDPSAVVTSLGDFLDSHLGNELHADALRSALRERGFRFRRLAGDPSTAPTWSAKRRFVNSLTRSVTPRGRIRSVLYVWRCGSRQRLTRAISCRSCEPSQEKNRLKTTKAMSWSRY